MHRSLLVIAAIALALTPVVGRAAEPSAGVGVPLDGLADALSRVPASIADGNQIVSYVDYRAVEAARPGAAQPASFAQLQALRDAGDASARLWSAAYGGVASGSQDLLRSLLRYGADWPTVVGFDFFEVDRELAFGSPPSDGLVLLGRFDPAAITRAFAARGYTATDIDARTLLCGPDGCDSGLEADLGHLDPANPFGGALGRVQPLAVSATDLLSSASGDTVRAMVGAPHGAGASLATDPAYRAATDALAAAGPVIQATFVPAALIDSGLVSTLLSGGDAAKAEIEKLAPTFEPIPPYEMLSFADGATATEQVVTMVLVYERDEDAQHAIDVLPRRIDALPSLRLLRPLRDVFEQRGVNEVKAEVRTAADGSRSLAVLTLHAPLAPSEPGTDGRMVASSLVYRMVVDMIEGRDTLWLAPTLPALP